MTRNRVANRLLVPLLMSGLGAGSCRCAIAAGAPARTLRPIPVLNVAPARMWKTRCRFAFVNASGHPLHYLIGPHGERSAADLHLSMFRDGKFVKRNRSGGLLVGARGNVRVLRPKAMLKHGVDLYDYYRTSKPGTYEIRAGYDVGEAHWAVKKLGLTPLQFKRTIALLHVGGSKHEILDLDVRDWTADIPNSRTLQVIAMHRILDEAARQTKLTFAFRNETGRPFRYMQRTSGLNCMAGLELSLFDKVGKRVRNDAPPRRDVPSQKIQVRTLKRNGLVVVRFDLGRFRDLKPGRYEVRAKYHVGKQGVFVRKHGVTPLAFDRTLAVVHVIESLPERLKQHVRHRFNRVEEKSRYVLGADIGLGNEWNGKATLFFAVRVSDVGKTKLKDQPESILRPLRVDPDAKVETMVYEPFPDADDPIIQIHVLVTESNKRQHYLVVDLTETNNPKLPKIKNKQALKPGTLFKLHKDTLGSVKLVPR